MAGVRIERSAAVSGSDEDRRVRLAIVHAVEEIEHLGPQLQVRVTAQADVLADRQIDSEQARAPQRIRPTLEPSVPGAAT